MLTVFLGFASWVGEDPREIEVVVGVLAAARAALPKPQDARGILIPRECGAKGSPVNRAGQHRLGLDPAAGRPVNRTHGAGGVLARDAVGAIDHVQVVALLAFVEAGGGVIRLPFHGLAERPRAGDFGSVRADEPAGEARVRRLLGRGGREALGLRIYDRRRLEFAGAPAPRVLVAG